MMTSMFRAHRAWSFPRSCQPKVDAVRATAERAYRALSCRGLSRVDFFVEHGTGRAFERSEHHAGFTDISMYPKLKIAAGQSYGQLLEELISLALQRAGEAAHV